MASSYARSRIPSGLKQINQKITGRASFPLLPYWMSFSLMNDGPGNLTVAINEEANLLGIPPISPGEPFSVDMEYSVIEALWLEAEAGSSCYVRIIGKW